MSVPVAIPTEGPSEAGTFPGTGAPGTGVFIGRGGVPKDCVIGQIVVYKLITSVVIAPIGQFITVAGHLVIV